MGLERLVKRIRDNDVVLWAGAGYSLYANIPSVKVLTEKIKEECSEEERQYLNNINSLSELCSVFVDMRNGSKNDLYQILNKAFRIEPESKWVHGLLTEIPQINTIVTTNYDKMFEKAYQDDLDVVVLNEQVPLISKNNVLYKIHGDLDFPKSIVITNEDYTNFFRNQDTPIWNKIKSLFAEKTIVFVGYSLADQNIDYLYDNIMSTLEGFQKESFLVAPNLPQYLINRLTKKKITYINLTGEKFTKYIHEEIKKNLLIDIQNGKVESQAGLKILTKYNLLAKFESSSEGLHLKSVGTSDNEKKMKLNIKFEGINFFEQMKKSPFNEFEIQGENIKSIRSHFEGINLPSEGKLITLKVIPKPIYETEVDLYFKEEGYELLNVNWELFGGYHDDLVIRLKHEMIKFEINFNELKLDFNIGKIKSIKYLKEIFNFLETLMLGKSILTVFFKDRNEEVDDFVRFREEDNAEMLEEIRLNLKYVEKLIEIQRKYKIMFKDFYFSLDKESIEIIDIIWSDLKHEKITIDSLNVSMESWEVDFIREYIEVENTFILESKKELPSLKIFNQTIEINKNICLFCDDVYVSNSTEVLEKINAGEKCINVILKSKAKEIYTYLENRD